MPSPIDPLLELLANVGASQERHGEHARTIRNPLQTAGDNYRRLQDVGQGIAGLLSLPAVAFQADWGDQNAPITQYSGDLVGRRGEPGSRDKFVEALLHPGRLNEQLQHSPDPVTSWLSGGTAMAADPTNLIPLPAIKLGKVLRLQKAKTALLKLLQGVPEAELGGVVEGAAEAATDLPLIPKAGDYRKFAAGMGLPVPEAGAFSGAPPSDLAPENFDMYRAIKERLAERGRTVGLEPDLSLGGLPTAPGASDYSRYAANVGLPPLGAPEAALPSSLTPKNFDLFRAAKAPRPFEAGQLPLDEAAPKLASLLSDLPPTPTTALDPLLSAPTPGSYDDFLKLARGVQGELPSPSANFWQRLGADPATVGDFFARGVGENLLGTTHAGTYAVKPGAFARYVPPSTRSIIDKWVDVAYDRGAFKAWPNLLKKLGAELTPEGILRGDQNITDNVLSYLMDHSELGTNRKAIDARYQQLLDELAPAVDEAVPNVDIPAVADEVSDFVPPETPRAVTFGKEGSFNKRKQFSVDYHPVGGYDIYRPALTIRQSYRDPKLWDVVNRAGTRNEQVLSMAVTKAKAKELATFALENHPPLEYGTHGDMDFSEEVMQQLVAKRNAHLSGGDIAAGGGGGLGIAPYVLPHGVASTLAGAGVGGLSGAGAGATAGFVQGEGDLLDRLGNAKEGALTGAALGAGVGALGGATLGKNTSAQAARNLIAKSNAAGVAGTKAAFTQARTKPTSLGGLFSYWSGQVVRHPKNIFNDELWNDLVTGALSPQSRQYIRDVRDSLTERMGMTEAYDRLSSPVQGLLTTFGKGRDFLPDLGIPLAKSVEDEALSIGQEVGYSTLLSAANPAGFAQNALGLLAGGPVKGTANTYWRQFFNAANGTLNNTFREAAFVSEAGKYARMGRQALIDSGQTGFAQFADDGLFSAADVAATLGAKEGAVWQAVQDNAIELAQDRVKFLFGDYGNKRWFERALNKAGVPFASWAIRAYPVALEMAVEHPVIALGIYHALNGLSQGAGENGRPGYTAGMVPLRDKAGLLTGGQGNTTYLDPIGSISPVGGEMFKGAEETSYDKSLFQDVQEGLSRVGLPGVNPIGQGLAYILGFDFKGPSALSRTQGLENALGLIPGNPDLPDIGGGGLRAARGRVSPLVAGTDIGALLGAQADPTPEQYDPIGRRYSELVVEATGRRLNDPSNKAYLLDLAFGRGELYARAEREALLGGAMRNVASLSSPVGAVAQTDTARQAKQATAANPFTFGAVNAIPQGTALRREAERGRKAALASDPWIEPYSIGGQAEAEDLILREIAERYQRAGARLTPAGLAEQLRLMSERAERNRITAP